MSYPGVDPGDVQTMNPVGAQEQSPGEPKLPETPTPPKLLKEQVRQEVMDEMFAVTDAWKPREALKFKIECPSGQVALVKHLDTMDLIEYGLVEELDFFTRRLFPKAIDPSGNPVEDDSEENETLWQALRDPEKRCRFMDMTGKLMAAASVKPKIVHDGVAVIDEKVVFGHQLKIKKYQEIFDAPKPRLKEGETYSGAIDFADRMAFFHELNRPVKQIEPFRPESADVLQNMAGSEGNGSEAQ